MLDDATSAQVAEHLGLLRHPVELVAALDDDEASKEVEELLAHVASLSDLITLTRGEHVRRPSFAVLRPGTPIGIRFAGAPTGDALSSFVLALLHVGGHPPKVPPEVAARIARLELRVDLETWFATSCLSCGETVQSFNTISVLNPTVQHTAINGAAFRDEAAARGIVGVPAVFVNGERLAHGRMSIERALDVLEALGV